MSFRDKRFSKRIKIEQPIVVFIGDFGFEGVTVDVSREGIGVMLEMNFDTFESWPKSIKFNFVDNYYFGNTLESRDVKGVCNIKHIEHSDGVVRFGGSVHSVNFCEYAVQREIAYDLAKVV